MLIMVVAHWILEECRRNQVKRQMQGQSSALAKIPIVGKAMDGNVILSTAALGVETAFTVITYPFRIRSRVRERVRMQPKRHLYGRASALTRKPTLIAYFLHSPTGTQSYSTH